MRLLKKAMLFLGVGVLSLGMFSNNAYAKELGALNVELDPDVYQGVNIEDLGNYVSVQRSGTGLPTTYDPRINGMIAGHVENQGNHSNCWAFAAVAAMESNLIKKGYTDSSINLSENHLTYFFYNRVKDPVGYTEGDQNIPMYYFWADNGGTVQGTALSLTTWSGTVKETIPEDDAAGLYVPKSLEDSECYKSDYRVANTYFYNYDVNTIKQAVMDYGAVAIGFHMDQYCYWTSDEKSYYAPVNDNYHEHEGAGGHAVTIVGWDDTYSQDNFVDGAKPSSPGAWIVKNSYGAAHGDGGYMYISYEESTISDIAAYDMVSAADSYDCNYQYDGSGALGIYYYQPSGSSVANVFRVKSSTYNEELKAVAINVLSTNVNYTVEIYTGVTGASPTSGKSVYKQSGTITKAGYNQIKLDKAITLAAKEKYAVVIKLTAPNGGNIKVACDASMNGGWVYFQNNVGSGQSYVKMGNKWYDTGKESGASKVAIYGDDVKGNAVAIGYAYSNARIKAYTDNTTQKTTYKLSSKSVGVSKGSTVKLSLRANPSSVQRKVTWSSASKKIATVSSSGKIKGKAYGKTTIKAKFAAGSGTKTLKCTVTVGPSQVKSLKVKGAKKKITVTWKKSSAASGYEISYSKKKDSGYKTLTTVKSGSTTKYSGKLKKGTYYVKMRPYITKDGKKLYGSYTSAKSVKVK